MAQNQFGKSGGRIMKDQSGIELFELSHHLPQIGEKLRIELGVFMKARSCTLKRELQCNDLLHRNWKGGVLFAVKQ